MVINDKEAGDLELTREMMWRRFRKNKPVYIGSTKYMIGGLIDNESYISTLALV